MGNTASCCNCNKDPSQKDKDLDFDKNPHGIVNSGRNKNSQRTSNRKNPYAPVKMTSNRNVDTSAVDDVLNK